VGRAGSSVCITFELKSSSRRYFPAAGSKPCKALNFKCAGRSSSKSKTKKQHLMKKITKNALCLLLFACSASFAQIPDPNDDPISEEEPPPPAPIDSSLAVLLLAGTGHACFQLYGKATRHHLSKKNQADI